MLVSIDKTTDQGDMQSQESAERPHRSPIDPVQARNENQNSFGQRPFLSQVYVQILLGSLLGAAALVIALTYFGLLVSAQLTSDLQRQIEGLREQNAKLGADLEHSDRNNREYRAILGGASPEEVRSQIAEMQGNIKALDQEIETMRAAEWPPLTGAARESLYNQLKELPARDVWVGYADAGGRELARAFSDVFKRLKWPQKYDILAVNDPQEGLWVTPISDFSEQVRDKIVETTGLQFKLFPHREQLPDSKQIGIIIGYRTPQKEDP